MFATLRTTWDAIFEAHQRFSHQRRTMEDTGRPRSALADDLDALVREMRLFVQQARDELAPWVAVPPTETYWAFVLQVSQHVLGSLSRYVEEWGQDAQRYRRYPESPARPLSLERSEPHAEAATEGPHDGNANTPSTASVLDAVYGWFEEQTRDYPQQIAGYRAQIQACRAEYQDGAVVDFPRALLNQPVIRTLEETVQVAEDNLRQAQGVLRDRTRDQQTAKALAHTPPRHRSLPAGWQVTGGGAL